jgi:N-acetylglucosamine-6-sulfatase
MESRADHHGTIALNPMIDELGATVITDSFKNRWRTLMSVDDLISDVIALCDELGLNDNTYFFYSSDHGFQLGEFNILMDKRHVYDWDTRIHLLARGPGIAADSTWSNPATQVDLAPTFLGIAGIAKPADMDGKSLLPLLIPSTANQQLAASTLSHLNALQAGPAYAAQWRDAVFIEYYYVDGNT